MEIIIKEDRYIDLVEAVAGEELLKTFTCQTIEDYNLFKREVIVRTKFARQRDVVRQSNSGGVQPLQELQRHDVDCYLLDQIEGSPRLFEIFVRWGIL